MADSQTKIRDGHRVHAHKVVLDDLDQATEHLHEAESRWEQQATELEAAQADLAAAQKEKRDLLRKLKASERRVEQERKTAQQQYERSARLAAALKGIHQALFRGNIYELILKACLSITGATRGLYITSRDGEALRVRAAIEVDGYPQAPPSEFLSALCTKVLHDNDTLVCHGHRYPSDLPAPSSAEDDFGNFIAAPVVLMANLSGIIVAADKLHGEFDEHDADTLLSVGDQAAVAVENVRLRQELQGAYLATVSTLADAMEAKDPYTHGHCDLVSHYSRRIAEQLDLSPEERSVVCYAALLHDIGKIGVSDGVLNKPGPLLPEEYELVRSHVRLGYELIRNVPALQQVADTVLHHHEWYDGTGYPNGLAGDDIPLPSRIVGTADAYCAMISARSYKDAYTEEQARQELRRCAGTQFDPRVVEAFLGVLETAALPPFNDEEPGCGVPPGFGHLRELRTAVV